MDSAVSRYREGDIFADKYRIERVLGVGGMGVVLAATHIDLGERRAIKLMHATGADDSEFVMRFMREARSLARLRGEHIARVHDVGRLGDGAPYMVIEYLEGTDLACVLETRTRLSVQEAVLFLLQVCEALAEAHVAGIVHRDLKPHNLFLTRAPDGSPHVKVIDFGIAKTTATDATQQKVSGSGAATKTGAWMGSPLYMSPEQIHSVRDVDARSDIWALGAILYELLTGKQVWPGTELMEIFYQVTMTAPIAASSIVPNLPPGLESVISRCLEKDRNRRFTNVAELAEALEPFATDDAKHFARKAIRIVMGRQSTIPQNAESSGEHNISFLPTMAAPTAAMQTPIPVPPSAPNFAPISAPNSPQNSLPTAQSTTSSSGRRTVVIAALALLTLFLVGAGAYVARGNAEETRASGPMTQPVQLQVESIASTANGSAVQPDSKVVVEPERPEVLPEKQSATTTTVVNAPSRAPAPQTSPNPNSTTAARVLPAAPVHTASPAVKPSPDKPRPGIIPR